MWMAFADLNGVLFYQHQETGEKFHPRHEGDMPPGSVGGTKLMPEPRPAKTTEEDRVRMITKLSLLWDETPDASLNSVLARAVSRCRYSRWGTANDKDLEQAIDDLLAKKDKVPNPQPAPEKVVVRDDMIHDAVQEALNRPVMRHRYDDYLYDPEIARAYGLEPDRYDRPRIDSFRERRERQEREYRERQAADAIRRERAIRARGAAQRRWAREEEEERQVEAREVAAREAERARIREERAENAQRYWQHAMVPKPVKVDPQRRNTEPLSYDARSWTGRK